MVRVCQDVFPKGTWLHQKEPGFELDGELKQQLDILIKNIDKDWDFTIIVTGQGEVRVGKSKLAMDIGYYWTYMINKTYKKNCPFSVKENFVFNGKDLIATGNKLGKEFPNSCLIYDEAGADLEGRKSMQIQTQDVLDYYRECGQYNMLNILVLPEYFDLPKGIALTRSIFLLDVYYLADAEGYFVRGFFNFFSKRQKKWLYLLGKRDLNYDAAKYDFRGKFGNQYQIDEKEYRAAKQVALMKRESKKRNKFQLQRDAAWYVLYKQFGMTQKEIAQKMEAMTGIFVIQQNIHDGLAHYKMENEDYLDNEDDKKPIHMQKNEFI
jgi:hypothetical protein